jgi:hypothetical protein
MPFSSAAASSFTFGLVVLRLIVPALLEIYHQDVAGGATNSNRPGYITEMLEILKGQDAAIPTQGSLGEPSGGK